jgi:adenosylcobinamide-GDP ribazoletransferase
MMHGVRHFLLALQFFTRVPVTGRLAAWVGFSPAMLRASAAHFPGVGWLVGAVGAGVFLLAQAGLPGMAGAVAAALLSTIATVLLTGAFHEDGLADVADGFGGGRDKMAKLAIMRDSRLGSYGVLALIFSVGLRWSALVALADPLTVAAALVASGVLSRAVVPAVYGWLDPARTDGLAAGLGGPPGARVVMASVLGACLAGLVLGVAALPTLAVAILAGLAVGWTALRQIGGHTGDVLGACQQVVEIAVLLTLVTQP